MKIIIITQIYPGYKEETTQTSPFAVHYFAKAWRKMGHEVQVIRIWPYRPSLFSFLDQNLKKYSYKETFELNGVIVHRVPVKKTPGLDFSMRENRRIAKELKEKISEFNTDVIISHSISPSYFISNIISKLTNIPLFLVVHKTDIKYLNKKMNKLKFKKHEQGNLKGIFFRSPVLKREYKSLSRGTKDANAIVPSGIESNEIISFDEFNRKGNRSTLNFIVACNLIKIKNVDKIINAISLLGEKKYNINFKIIGDGPERNNLEKLARENELHNIQFLGHLDRNDVLEHMFNSDFFIMVSSPETFGLVYIEAMAKGCIVIGSKNEGIDGIVKNGENGFLCKVGDVEELSKIIKRCINMNKDEKLTMLQATYETVKELTIEKCASDYLAEITKRLK